MINTVKLQADIDNPTVVTGYLVNGNLNVPIVDGNRDYKEVTKWIADGNTPEPAYTQAQLDEYALNKQKQALKDEMNALIGDMTPAESMMLMLRYGMAKMNPPSNDDDGTGGGIDTDLTPGGEDLIQWGDYIASQLVEKTRALRVLG